MSDPTLPAPAYPGYTPLTIGQILDRIFRLFRTHVVLFLKIASVLAAAFFAFYGLIGGALFAAGAFPTPHHPPDPVRVMSVLFPVFAIGVPAYMMVYALFEAAATHAALEANVGNKVSFREAYAVAWTNAGRFFWLIVLRYLWVALPVLVCFAIIAGLALLLWSRGGIPHPGVFFLAFPMFFLAYGGSCVYLVLMSIRLALATPACLAERLPAAAALRRSLDLTRNAKGRIFLVMLVVYAAAYVAFMVFEAVCFAVFAGGMLLSAALHIHWGPGTAIAFFVPAMCLLATLFLLIAAMTASYSIAFAVLYHDQRLRLEGVPPLAPNGVPA
jgi:hypothetical protein